MKFRWVGGTAREMFEEVVSRMSVVASGDEGGVDDLASRAGEAAWVGDLAPEADNAAGEALALKVFGAGEIEDDEEDTEDILREARTRAACGSSNGAQGARGGKSTS